MNKLILFSSLFLALSLSPDTSADTTASKSSALASRSLLTDIVKLDDNQLVAVGDRGHILYSDDGEHWTQAQVPVNVLLTDVFFLNSKHGWAVGHDATIVNTSDGGQSWQLQHQSVILDKPLFGIHFKDNREGFAFGAYGLFLRTTDGGRRWQKEFHAEFLHPDDLDYINELKQNDAQGYEDESGSILPHFNRALVDGSDIYLVGEVGLFARSGDYGRSWTKLEAFYNGSFFDVAKTPFGLYVTGLRGHVYVRHGGKGAFEAVDIKAKTSVNRVLSNHKKLVLLGNSGLIRVSNDGGKTFAALNLPDGKALTGGVFWRDKLILTSATGIKVISGGQW